MADPALALHETVRALSHPYAVDGRVSWHPPDVRGFAPANCYLVAEGHDALLIDTGLTIHREAVAGQLERLLGDDDCLALLVLRQGEFDSVGNLVPLVDRFGVTDLYGQFDDVIGWADFHPGAVAGQGALRGPKPRSHVVGRRDTLELGGVPRLHAHRPALRLLNTFWLYDEASRCLFTSDSFGHCTRSAEAGPWIVTAEDDPADYETVRSHLLATRYWWIPQADVGEIRRDLASVFEAWPVETICPAWGCVLQGSEVVSRHYQLVDDVLRREARAR
ncbi:MAG: hypothetical protein QOE75_2019 [Solirubrobacterales bacterium]|nr:hypothetical protein [Solirubrobacterales bacterium]